MRPSWRWLLLVVVVAVVALAGGHAVTDDSPRPWTSPAGLTLTASSNDVGIAAVVTTNDPVLKLASERDGRRGLGLTVLTLAVLALLAGWGAPRWSAVAVPWRPRRASRPSGARSVRGPPLPLCI
ncbi:MAG TPA: hypothetical protein VFA94_16525 [Acidimicrobiales bacterium]|nr:hypothetical protein [Acidimicrobiales bacterium]